MEWTLTTAQMLYMMKRHNRILKAYENDDMDDLCKIAKSKSFKKVFGKMSFDEAYDRYEAMCGE